MTEKTIEAPKPAPAAKDRRAHPRYKFTAVAEVLDQKTGKKIETKVGDLGRLGCFLDTSTPLPLGTMVTVRINRAQKSFDCTARVVSSTQGKGMGLLFTAIDPENQAILTDWLASSLETSWLASTRRRSQRILVKIAVTVAGQNKNGAPFEEQAYTLAASAHGALLLLSTNVTKGQQLTLRNDRTEASLECVVAHIGDTQDKYVQIGVAFILPNPGFWNASFPPEDWSIRHPDAKKDTHEKR